MHPEGGNHPSYLAGDKCDVEGFCYGHALRARETSRPGQFTCITVPSFQTDYGKCETRLTKEACKDIVDKDADTNLPMQVTTVGPWGCYKDLASNPNKWYYNPSTTGTHPSCTPQTPCMCSGSPTEEGPA